MPSVGLWRRKSVLTVSSLNWYNDKNSGCKTFYGTLMELPINDKELNTIVSALRLGGDAALYQKMKSIKDIREQHPGGAYKKIAREQFGFVL